MTGARAGGTDAPGPDGVTEGPAPDGGPEGPAPEGDEGRRDPVGLWLARRRAVAGPVAVVLAAALGVVWLVVVPDEAERAAGWREVALRYGHPACWFLLAVAALAWTARAPRRWVEVPAWAALACYAAFLAASVL